MPRQFALCITVALIMWLYSRDRALRGRFPGALWIPLLWLCIIGSRPISSWFGFEVQATDAVSEGSPLDRFVFLVLIFGALAVLWRRRVSWVRVAVENKSLSLFLIYLGISTLWADYPFASFKRWIKDIGNVAMVLVILSEKNPIDAIKSILFRFGSFVIPMSILLIKYYPDLGRYLNPFIWTYSYGGVALDKNTLGMSLFAGGMGIFWGLLDLWNQRLKYRKEVFAHLLLIGLCLWLWYIAKSATSLACAGIGACILLGMKMPAIGSVLRQVGMWGLLVLAFCVLFLSVLFNPVEAVTSGLGRDITLTGRTDIWREVLRVDINPLIGAGYSSFWYPDRAEKIGEALGFFFQLKEAHNGYLEVYLNSGFAGLALLVIVLLGSIKRTIFGLNANDSLGTFRFATLVGGILYNMTESAFCGLVMLWVVLLLVIIKFPRPSNAVKIVPQS